MAVKRAEVSADSRVTSRPAVTANARSRRAEVIGAASRIFFQKGYRAATIQDIGNAMNFTSAALYYYVGSKQQLLTEIVLEPNRRLVEIAERVCDLDVPLTERLRRIIVEHVNLMLREREMFGVMFRERIEITAEDASTLRELEDRYYALVRDIISRGVEANEFVVRDASVATLGLMGMINWTTRWYRKDGGMSPEQIAQHYFEIFYMGIAPRSLS